MRKKDWKGSCANDRGKQVKSGYGNMIHEMDYHSKSVYKLTEKKHAFSQEKSRTTALRFLPVLVLVTDGLD